MKKLLLLFLPVFFPFLLSAQTEPADYKITMGKFKEYYNKNQSDSLYRLFGKAIKATLPADKAGLFLSQLKGQFGDLKTLEFASAELPITYYNADFEKGKMVMTISLDEERKLNNLFFKPQTAFAKPVAEGLKESALSIKVDGGTLFGSVVMPEKANGKIPVVLIIAGSGATDRNGNSGKIINANAYYILANDLGKAGIATLRFDKRGVGQSYSSKQEADLRFDDYSNDAIAWIKQLKADSRFSKVIVLGHSEGSLVGMIAVEKEKVDAYISVAGPGDAIDKILKVQLKNEPPQNYKIDAARVDSLSKGMMVKAGINNPMFRQSVQPYLISWMKYNPQTEIKKLKIPVLIVQGTHDIQVTVDDAKKLKKANPAAQLALIDGMNHVFKPASEDRTKNMATYTYPLLPLDTNFKNTVIGFVNQLK